jgi:hypothetical protein
MSQSEWAWMVKTTKATKARTRNQWWPWQVDGNLGSF